MTSKKIGRHFSIHLIEAGKHFRVVITHDQWYHQFASRRMTYEKAVRMYDEANKVSDIKKIIIPFRIVDPNWGLIKSG